MATSVQELKTIAAVPPPPRRASDANKGDVGKITIIGGSRGMSGAPCLSARAAYRSGAGLVRVAVPMSIWDIVATKLDECTTQGLRENSAGSVARKALREFGDAKEWSDVFVIGPGLSGHADTADEVRNFVSRVATALVIDADALNAFVGKAELLRGSGGVRVLTPHPGEMARLLKLTTAQVQSDRTGAVFQCAKLTASVVVLKGSITLVCDGERLYSNTSGNSGMATGGTGDVLTGIIAALIGQRMSAFDAACLGVYLHGYAGDISASRLGIWSLIASDLIDDLPKAFMMYGSRKTKNTIKM